MTTRPGEIARIRELAGGDEYRAEVLTALAVLQERSEHQTEWMREHDRRDNERFSALEQRVTGVSSSVTGFEALKNQGIGMKSIVVGAGIALAGITALVWTVMQIVTSLGSKTP